MKKLLVLVLSLALLAGCVLANYTGDYLDQQKGKATYADIVMKYGPPDKEAEVSGVLVCRWNDVRVKRATLTLGEPKSGHVPTPLIASFSLPDKVMRSWRLP